MKFGILMQTEMPIGYRVKIETGKIIPIWRTFVFRKRK